MKAETLSPRSLFDGTVHFEIPVYQRPYVWTEEDQWAPLWDDIRDLAERVTVEPSANSEESEDGGHFMGAVVLKQKSGTAKDVTRYEIVDGQQRLTTLQLALSAARASVEALGTDYEDHAEILNELLVNPAKRFDGTPERFKLRPSRGDSSAFARSMMGEDLPAGEHRISDGRRFFIDQMASWLEECAEGNHAPLDERTRALVEVLTSQLQVVGIYLDGSDNDQLIFETLNDRGTPLLKADLIKNWIFQEGEKAGADIARWADEIWSEFDDEWWREEVRQGRHLRSRIDTFLQYWIIYKTAGEVQTGDIFTAFRSLGSTLMRSRESADQLLDELAGDAAFYRTLVGGTSNEDITEFYEIVVNQFELATFIPLVFRLASPRHGVPKDQVSRAFEAVESWVIRRTLVRATMKDVNKLVVALLQTILKSDPNGVGDDVVKFFARQSAEARYWPSDSELQMKVPALRMYGNIRQNRLRVILEGAEKQLRSDRNESVAIKGKLEVEHIFPQKWHLHWNSDAARGGYDDAMVSNAIDTLGNLTLVTKKLNGSLSNRAWRDSDVKDLGTNAPEPDKGKRSLLGQFSVLAMNRGIVESHPEEWTVGDIHRRSVELTDLICSAWPAE